MAYNEEVFFNQEVDGMHFRLEDMFDNASVVKELDGLMLQLKEIVLESNKSYYIDFEAYNTVKDYIDYLNIYKSISEECD